MKSRQNHGQARTKGMIENSGYSHHGASRSKPSMLKWYASSKSPHEDISENLALLRSRSRDLYAGSPLGRGAVDRIVLNAIGSGLKLNVRIDPDILGMSAGFAGDWAQRTEAEFDYWASSKDCDYSRMMNFYELQVLAFRSVLLDGDCLALLPDRYIDDTSCPLSVMLLEAERLADPLRRPAGKMIDEGVELDTHGRPCAYWIANRNPEQELINQPMLEYHRVKLFGYKSGRRNILHLMLSERIGQHRGVPLLAPVIEPLKQLTRYTDAELMAAVVSGMYAIFFEHEQLDGEYGEEEYASEEGLGGIPGLEDITQEEMSGMMMDLPAGVKPVGVSPGRPNQNFMQFVEALVKQVGGALGIPAELLFMQFTASYSASRGALLEAWKLFKFWRSWFAANFCQMVYEEWLTEAVLLGRINAPGYFTDKFKQKAYAWAEWVGPAQGQLNPLQEVNASIAKINANLSTYQREAGELTGEDWDLIMKQRQRENDILKEVMKVVPNQEPDG